MQGLVIAHPSLPPTHALFTPLLTPSVDPLYRTAQSLLVPPPVLPKWFPKPETAIDLPGQLLFATFTLELRHALSNALLDVIATAAL